MKLKNIPFILGGMIILDFLGLLLGSWFFHDRLVPHWVENIYAIGFLAPEFILCRPWAGVLQKLGLVEGEWWRLPSLGGCALVNSVYVLVLFGVGLFLRRRDGK